MTDLIDPFDTPATTGVVDPFSPAATPPTPKQPATGFLSAAARGFKRSLPETQSLLYGAGAALAGAVGADEWRDSTLANYQRIEREQVQPLQNQATFKGVLAGDDSAGEWAGDVLGNFGGQALQSLATAAAGAAIGSAAPGAGTAAGAVGGLVARGAAKRLITESVESLVADQMRKGIAREAAEAAGKVALQRRLQQVGGATLAGLGLNTAQEAGIAYTGRADDAAEAGEGLDAGDAWRALGAGAVAGAVDSAAEGIGVGRLLKGASSSPRVTRRLLAGATQGAITEGGTEGVQAALERWGAQRDLTGAEATDDYIENIAAGALGGGVMGAAGGVRRSVPEGQPPNAPTLALPSPVISVDASGEAITPAQAFQQQQADVDFIRRRQAVDLAGNVNPARPFHSAAIPNVDALVDGGPMGELEPLSGENGKLRPQALAPGMPPPLALPPPDITINEAGEAVTAAQTFQQQQADAEFVRSRQSTGLTADVNQARAAHPGAAPNESDSATSPSQRPLRRLSIQGGPRKGYLNPAAFDGTTGLPDPNNGPLSRAINVAAEQGALQGATDSAQTEPGTIPPTRGFESRRAVGDWRGSAAPQRDTAMPNRGAESRNALPAEPPRAPVTPDLATVTRVREYLAAQADRGPLPKTEQLVAAFGLNKRQMGELRSEVLVERRKRVNAEDAAIRATRAQQPATSAAPSSVQADTASQLSNNPSPAAVATTDEDIQTVSAPSSSPATDAAALEHQAPDTALADVQGENMAASHASAATEPASEIPPAASIPTDSSFVTADNSGATQTASPPDDTPPATATVPVVAAQAPSKTVRSEASAGAVPASSGEFVRVRDVYGDSHRVRAADLNGTRAMLPTYNVDGKRRLGRSVLRDNLDQDGSRARETWKDLREISRKGATSAENVGFRSRRAALAAIEQHGQSPDDFDLVSRGGGLVAVRKPTGSNTHAPPAVAASATKPRYDKVEAVTPAGPPTNAPAVYDSAPKAKEQRDGELPESSHQSDRPGELPGAEHERPADSGRVESAGDLVRGKSEEISGTRGKRRTRAAVEEDTPTRVGRRLRDAADEPASDAERVLGNGRAAAEAVAAPADFNLTDELEFQGVGDVKKFNHNLNAIAVLKAVEARGTPATPEEQSALARYVGWGGLPQAFQHPTTGAVKKGWEQRVADLAAALSAEELAAAGRSTQDAHYTARNVVDAMWSAVVRLGFTHGRVLEPSLGTGNFFGRMPASIRAVTQRTGVELDPITGRIARLLYPRSNVQVRGFHELRVVPESFDLVIGNPPFGAQSVHDPQYPDLSRFSIHNYFFAKSIMALRPGGLLAMVVSNSFLDANTKTTRQWVSERARFLGAIRLPQTAFAKNAGTNVTTDIVFLQRLAEGVESNPEDWVPVEQARDERAGQSFSLNRYYRDRPQRMLGRMVWSTHTTHGAQGAVLAAWQGVDLGRALDVAVSKLPKAVYLPPGIPIEQMEQGARDAESAAMPATAPGDHVKVYGYYVDADGTLRQRQPDHNGEKTQVDAGLKATESQRVRGMVGIRDAMRRLLAAELLETSTDAEVADLRVELNRVYDAFTKVSGLLSRDANKRAFRSDPDAPLLLSLERDYDRGVSREAAKKAGTTARPESARKADLLSKRVQYPVKPVTKVSDAKSAMLASLNERGRIDMDFMRALYPNTTADDLMRELGDLAYALPDGTVEPSDAYLSGNVKAKLVAARAAAEADRKYRRNVDALERVQPAHVDPADIFVQLGTPWIPTSDYAAFAKETFEGALSGQHVAALGQWVVQVKSQNRVLNHDRWGTDRMGAEKLMAALMMNKPITVYDASSSRDQPPILNKEATAAAQGKAAELVQAFGDWIWKDADRRERLARHYNDTFNTNVERGFDGAHMSFPGMARGILANGELRPHQSGFAYRMIQDGVALAEHVVGAGKTYASIAGVMEMRRLGLWRKPMIVVPNHLVDQWSADFLRLYPGANVLAASRQDFERGKRRQLFGRIATGEWDAVIVAHSSFGFIPLPADAEENILKAEVQEIGEALDAIRASEGKNSLSFKQLQKRKDRIIERLDRISERSRDDLLDFAEMGVDALVVDEAHEFKNLFFVTTQRNVAGLGSPEGSKKAFDLFVKMRYLEGVNQGKNRVFLTGTPVSNTLSEVYHFQRYLQYGALSQLNVTQFDAWSSTFGAMVTDWEMDAAGRFKEKKRFSKFANLPELRTMWRQFADTVTRADLVRDAQAQGRRFPLPKIKTGGPQNIVVARSPLQAAYIGIPEQQLDGNGQPMLDPETGTPKERYPRDSIIGRMENMPKDPSIDNHLKATGDARKAGLDYRLVDPSAPDFAESKINVAAGNIVRIWQGNKARRGTQLVFCDLSVPASARGRATEAAQAKGPTWFVRNDAGHLEHVDGVKVALSAWPERVFFLRKIRNIQLIVDAGSGATVARESKRQDVIDLANARLAKDREQWQRRFETEAIASEDIDAYVARWEAEQEAKEGGAADEAGDAEADASQAVVSLDELLADQSRFSVYDDLKAKLIAQGIPAEQIAFIHDFATDQRKADLFAKVNRGDIRVLMGSTAKMGAGMNVQRKLVALHHLDAPWRPSDLEQREGRIVRQGNEFYEVDPDGFEIEILRYATKQTYDARQWEILERKARGIESFRAGDASVREIEDVTSEAANAAEMKGSASGNPLILESVRLRSEVRNLEAQERSHKRSIHQMEAVVRKFNAGNHYSYTDRDRTRRAVDQLDRDGPFELTLGERTFDERKGVKAEPVLAAFKRATSADGPVRAGSFRGADIWVDHRGDAFRVTLQVGDFTVGQTEFGREGITPGGYVSRLENMIERSDRLVAEAEARVQQFEREAKQASEEMTRGFPQQGELDGKRERFQKVVAALRAGKQAVDGDPAPTGAFSRPRRPVERGTPAVAVRRAIAPIIAGWSRAAPRVIVVETGGDLPASAQSQAGYADAEGFYDGESTVYLVAANLTDVERAKAVLAHEAIGHYGIEAITGPVLWGQLESTVDTMRSSGRYADLFAEIDRRYRGANRGIATREAIAVMAEKGIRNSVIDRVIAALRRFLRALGFDVAFSAAELRQLIAQAARYVRDGARPRAARLAEAPAWSRPAPRFYSAFTESVRNAKGAPKVAAARQWQQWLDGAQRRGEFRQGERDWSGVDEWLAARDKTTRQELADYVNFNELVLHETVLFDLSKPLGPSEWEKVKVPAALQADADKLAKHGFEVVRLRDDPRRSKRLQHKDNPGVLVPADDFYWLVDEAAYHAASNIEMHHGGYRKLKELFKEYSSKEGERYRELLLRLPVTQRRLTSGQQQRIRALQQRPYNTLSNVERIELDDAAEHEYFSGHFPQDTNILAHVRFNERVDSEGRSVLFIEEIQSDWHQQGRREGYRPRGPDTAEEAEYRSLVQRLRASEVLTPDEQRRRKELHKRVQPGWDGVPDAPMKNAADWSLLVFKRMVRWAVDHGMDRIAWTSGAQQAARYAGTDANQARREQGLGTFYDQLLPSTINQWAKRFNGRAGRHVFGLVGEAQEGSHVIDLTPAMQDAARAGLPMFSRPDPNRSASRLELSDEGRESVKDWLAKRGAAKLTDLKPALLGAIPMNALSDFAPKKMPGIGHYLELRYQLDAYRHQRYVKTDAIAQKWLSFATGGGARALVRREPTAQARALADLMHDSTVAGVDPTLKEATYKKDPEKVRIHRELRRRFDALPTDGQELYVSVRNAYTEQMKLIEKALAENLERAIQINRNRADREYEDRLEEIEEDPELDDAGKAEQRTRAARLHASSIRKANQRANAQVIKLREKFEAQRVDAPYFPLKRFGRYFAVVKRDGRMVGFSKFEGRAELDAFAEKMREQGLEVRAGVDAEKTSLRQSIDPGFVADIQQILDDAGAPDFLRDEVYQLYLERLPDLSLRKSFIHRKKVPGYNADALRAFGSAMFHGSYQLARLKYALEMGEALDVAEQQAKEHAPIGGMLLVNELRKRHEFILNPKGGAAAQIATSAAFVYHLGANPAHLFLNATQTLMLGVPILGSRYGFGKASSALTKAAQDFARGKGHIERAALTTAEQNAAKAFVEMGVWEKTQAHDLAGVGDKGVEYSAVRQRVMSKLGWIFHQSERFNREVTSMTAYRLAREAGDTHDAAVQRAAKLTYEVHFDYSAANRPRWMQSDVAKVLFVFRNYNVNLIYRLFRDVHQSFRAESPEARAEARRQLGAMMGMYALMAGVTGVPLYGLAVMMAGLFEDDDEPLTAEQQFARGTRELLGEDAARLLLSGVPGSLLGVDVSERIGLPNLWFRSPDRELEGRDAYFFWMEQVLGAAMAIPKNLFTGLQQVHEGHIERGIETMVPAFVRSPLRALRYAGEGATTLDGQSITDVTPAGVLAQALGLSPLAVAEQYEKNSELKGADARLNKRRQQLMNRYFMAVKQRDNDGAKEVLAEIRWFNRGNSAYAITRETLQRSQQMRARHDAMADHGITVTRRMRALGQDGATER
ncbi:PLxRFG domain-containing protein [Lysobacter firmicutimachus]|uniref:PLxRFG domain-containing protein n=1 Tax=Lysobacter firmicutimachus TaxID=1792846 RepID=A0ABU8CYM5_9GAMM